MEVGVNKSADVCVIDFTVDGKDVGFSAFVSQKLVNFTGVEFFCLR